MKTLVWVTITARNTVFSDRTQKLLDLLQSKADNKAVIRWVTSNLRRWLINDYDGEDLHQITQFRFGDPVYVKRALDNGEEVFVVNATETLKKTLLNCIAYLNTVEPHKIERMSVPQVMQAAKLKPKVIKERGITEVMRFPNGYKWVRITNKASIIREGEKMHHCVGEYCVSLLSGDTQIYSLRDRNNAPHVTLEFVPSSKSVEQIKGYNNQVPAPKYRFMIVDFLNSGLLPWTEIDSIELGVMGMKVKGKQVVPQTTSRK